MKRVVLCTIGCAILANCGGGGSSSSTEQATFTGTPIRVFSDGAGVASIKGRADGQEISGYLITPELSDVLAELERTNEIPDVDTNLPIVATGPNTIIRQGAASFDGFTANVLLVTTNEEDVAVTLVEDPFSNLSILVTEGPVATSIPTSGIATYTGTMGLGPRLDSSAAELGTFTAQVDFGESNPTVSFDGSTSSYSANGTALVAGGSFSSTAITIGTPSEDVAGSLRGDFHDANAQDTAGVIFSNDSQGRYSGAFVGSK